MQRDRLLDVLARALERCEVADDSTGAADEAAAILREVVQLDATEVERKPRKVSEILTDIVELGDNELDFLLQMLDSGMWDEWDTSLVGGLGMFGAAEVRIAARSGQMTAKYIEEHPSE